MCIISLCMRSLRTFVIANLSYILFLNNCGCHLRFLHGIKLSFNNSKRHVTSSYGAHSYSTNISYTYMTNREAKNHDFIEGKMWKQLLLIWALCMNVARKRQTILFTAAVMKSLKNENNFLLNMHPAKKKFNENIYSLSV